MANNNNIKNFTIGDIEKYHNGSLSQKERHDLERAALDDPFLADALEGYTVAGNGFTADLAELRSRLNEKIESSKVIPLDTPRRKPIPWLRVAALVIVIAGAAFLASQLVFKNKNESIAKAEQNENAGTKATDNTVTGNVTTTNPVTINNNANGSTAEVDRAGTKTTTESLNRTKPLPNVTTTITTKDAIATNEPVTKADPVTITNPPVITDEKNKQEEKNAAIARSIGKEKNKEDQAERKIANMDKDGVTDILDKVETAPAKRNDNAVTTRRAAEQPSGAGTYGPTNTFRGRVTDANNVGVPFANVTNAQDNNAGTYTDAKGYFNLTYPDSVVSVQVRSIGFENSSAQLRNNVPNNQVVLQDDKSLSEVVISNKKPNTAARNRDDSRKLEEPEPADGWENYDAYLANNLNEPEEVKTKQAGGGQVQVSFEVNKNGEPVDIKVEKSLCSKCDQEAIRLIKEGPKWKRAAYKKGRTIVTINF